MAMTGSAAPTGGKSATGVTLTAQGSKRDEPPAAVSQAAPLDPHMGITQM